MLKKEIRAALDALREIKLPKIEDKELRNAIIEDHFALLDAGRKTDAKLEDMRTVFLEANKDEEKAVSALQVKISEAESREEQIALSKELRESHKDYQDAVKEFNENVAKLLAEEVNGIKPIDRQKFLDAVKGMDNMKLSWVEALYPLLFENE